MLLLAALWPSLRFRKVLLSYSFLVMLTLAILHLVSDEQNNILAGFFFAYIPTDYFTHWIPFVWPDYLGYMAAWWWISFMLTFPHIRIRTLMPISLLVLVVIFASSNHGAFLFLSYALLITLTVKAVRVFSQKHFREVTLQWRQLSIVALLLPLLWLFASPYLPTNYSANESQSLPTRILLNQISLTALVDEPSRLVIGSGWGRYADDFFKYSLVRDIRIYDDGRHNPNWPLVRGYNYHSHNMASAVLLSLGIVGFILWLLMPIVAIRTMPAVLFWQAGPMLIAVTLLQHVWFAMPQTMPFQALCWFLLLHHTGTEERNPISSWLPAFIVALLCAALITTSLLQYKALRYSMALSDPFGHRYGIPVTKELLEEDIMRGGDRLRPNFINYTKRLSKSEAFVQPKHIELYRTYLEAMHDLTEYPTTGAYNGASILYGYNVLITTLQTPAFKELRQLAAQDYFTMAKAHTARAPHREDIIAPFLQAMYDIGDDDGHQRLMAMVQELLAIHPMHRSALWLGGKVLAAQPGMESQGKEMMAAALSLGADRVFLIPKSEIADLH